ncbi:hypothetical protein HUU05_17025, partial [candidate division KSB1 bacterium]|nr:hypothetical protein [candidate division KSB1 bacterium]
ESLGRVHIDQENWQLAIARFNEAIQIADEIGKTQDQNEARQGLALAHLYSDDLSSALQAVKDAAQYDLPQNNHNVLALLGAIALRQADRPAALEAFAAAVQHTEHMLAHSAQNYEALDAKGLAWSGLALCEGPQHVAAAIAAAIAAFRAARALNQDAGIVKGVLRLFDELAKADKKGVLKEVRAAAAGE